MRNFLADYLALPTEIGRELRPENGKSPRCSRTKGSININSLCDKNYLFSFIF